MSRAEDLEKLKAELGKQLICDPAQLKRPEGIPTGHKELDQFLLWKGFPKGALSILTGRPGLGATSLWLGAAAHVTKQGRWAVWVDECRGKNSDREAQLFPLHLWQKELDLSRLVTIEAPETERKTLWLLQELMASTLFELIGCDLGQARLRDSQVRQLEKQARACNTALVFLTGQKKVWSPALYSLIVNFKASEIEVERALHKPTPFSIARRVSYDSFTTSRNASTAHTTVSQQNRLVSALSAATIKGLEPSVVFDYSESRRRATDQSRRRAAENKRPGTGKRR